MMRPTMKMVLRVGRIRKGGDHDQNTLLDQVGLVLVHGLSLSTMKAVKTFGKM
jgi:hypothetical protein